MIIRQKYTSTRRIVLTGLMLALTLVFQMLRFFIPMPSQLSIFIIGTLVNATLLVTVVLLGLGSGTIICVAAPMVAFFQGHIAFPWMVPIIAIGNFTIILIYYLFHSKAKGTAVLLSSFTKFVFLLISTRWFIGLLEVPAKPAQVLSYAFSWPQLITALLGGIVSISVLRILEPIVKR